MLCHPRLKIAILNEEIEYYRTKLDEKTNHGWLYNVIWTLERRVKELEEKEETERKEIIRKGYISSYEDL